MPDTDRANPVCKDDLVRPLIALLARGLEADTGAAPCLIARDLDSPAVAALLACQSLWRGRGLRPILLLGAAPASTDALKDLDIVVRIATPDIASLLREQLIAGELVWCGGHASPRASASLSPGRTFENLSLVEMRAFAMVFQGLWASSKPLAMQVADREPRRSTRRELAGAVR